MGDSVGAALHRTGEELEAGLDHIRESPADGGPVRMIVRRPEVDAREVIAEGELDVATGLVGDGWKDRGSTVTPTGGPNIAAQVTIINSRLLNLLAQSEERWPLAGDQLVIDIDMSEENLPPGSQLSIGSAVIEISKEPHTGCAKFAARFGHDALRFISTPLGRQMRMRGINTRVVQSGTVRVGDVATKIGA
ncbi:MAG: MOSC domain-containing protein [Chloroflexi bacterium]|nr:MOSC domain-containing protein [Chloroflexota bacterium]